MRIFLEKTVKNWLSDWESAPEPPFASASRVPPSYSRVVTLAYYYIFVEFISWAKCLLLP